MRAIYTVWSNIHREWTDDRGQKTVYVNMNVPIDFTSAQMIPCPPDAGRMAIVARESADFRLRPPAWVPRETVRAWVDGERVQAQWEGAYIAFDGANPGDQLAITYPLATYSQDVAIFEDPNLVVSYSWEGITAIGVDPAGKDFPMHIGKRQTLPPGPVLPE
jgi:hypothetical protein